MQHRGRRLAILCLLLAAGSLAGFFVWSTERTVHQLDDRRESKLTTIDRLLSSISAIATAQQAFTDFGRKDVASFTRVSVLVDRITTDAAGLRAAAESSSSSERLEEFWTALSALMGAESRARERLAGGDESGAADAILASSREHVNVLNSSLQAFRDAELENFRAMRAAMIWRSWACSGRCRSRLGDRPGRVRADPMASAGDGRGFTASRAGGLCLCTSADTGGRSALY